MRLKILSVDDDPTIRRCIAASFQTFACEVLEAADGIEGLTLAKQERPDLILLDFIMPGMDGSEMLAKLKSDPTMRNIPVMVLTAEATRERVVKLLQQGVNDYLLKPFRKDQIVERVGRIVDLKPKAENDAKVRRFDDPLEVLVVDDKPAIIEQIRQALAGTKWTVRDVAQPGQALDQCTQLLPDVVLISLSLAGSAGFMLCRVLQTTQLTRDIPVLGLSVKIATHEQAQAHLFGFSGIVTKPVTAADLRSKIASVLHLDTSAEYFQVEAGVLVLTLPAQFQGSVLNDILNYFPTKLAEAVDAGFNRVILELSQVEKADVALVRLGLAIIRTCRESQIPCGLVASEALRSECATREATRSWRFARSFDEALALFNDKTPAMA
jgi:two-component system, cell cycle response regulator